MLHLCVIELFFSNANILPIEVKSGHGNTLRSLHLFLETHLQSTYGLRFSTRNYSMTDTLESRPLYAAVSLVHESQKEALEWLCD